MKIKLVVGRICTVVSAKLPENLTAKSCSLTDLLHIREFDYQNKALIDALRRLLVPMPFLWAGICL